MHNRHRHFQFFSSDNEKLLIKLNSALRFVNHTCVLGAENKFDDELKTNGWNMFALNVRRKPGYYVRKTKANKKDILVNRMYDEKRQLFLTKNQQWYYHTLPSLGLGPRGVALSFIIKNNLKPLEDPQFKLNEPQINLLLSALVCQELRGGTCHFRANLLAKYLWEHPEGINRIEVVNASNFEHVFVIVNRQGVLNDPRTWGNAYIIDPWFGADNQGLVYKAVGFQQTIKEIRKFADQQFDRLKVLGLDCRTDLNSTAEVTQCLPICEIKPKENPYPTYCTSPFKPLEDYYSVNLYPTNKKGDSQYFFTNLTKDFFNHKNKFQFCMQELNANRKPLCP